MPLAYSCCGRTLWCLVLSVVMPPVAVCAHGTDVHASTGCRTGFRRDLCLTLVVSLLMASLHLAACFAAAQVGSPQPAVLYLACWGSWACLSVRQWRPRLQYCRTLTQAAAAGAAGCRPVSTHRQGDRKRCGTLPRHAAYVACLL